MNSPQDHQQIQLDYSDQQIVKKKKKVKKNKDAGLSWSIYRLFKLMFPVRCDWKALLPIPLFIFAVGMGVIFAWMYNKYTTLAGDIVNAVYADDRDKFWDCIRRMALYIVTGSMMQAIVMAIGDVLCGMIWRKSISGYLDKRYTRNKNFFKILNLDDRIKDADQRIVADVNLFLRKFKTIIFGEPNFTGILINCCSITWFTVTLSERGSWFLPLVVWAYFIAGMLISRVVMIPATMSTKKQAKLKGEYQFAHSYFRVNTENIAMWEGQDFEYAKLKKYLFKAIKHYGYVVVYQFPINYFGLAWQWGCQLACYVFPAVAWWDMKISGCTGVDNYFVVTQVSYNLLWTFSLCLLLAQESTELFGVTKRLGELIKVLDDLENQPGAGDPLHVHNGEIIEYKGVTCTNPYGEALIHDISFEVQPDSSVLIMGPSGIGKSSLIRILSGLWPCPTGSVVRPKRIGRGGIVFMPQKPYLSLGTFKEQITYPLPPEILSDAEMMDLLSKVKLGYLVQRYSEDLEKTKTWSNMLSGGEQQRLSIARLLFHCPKYAVMDEATSAIDENGENHIFSELKLHGITLLSVAHRKSVKRFHKRVVQLEEGGFWSVTDTDSTIDGPPKYSGLTPPTNSYANFYDH